MDGASTHTRSEIAPVPRLDVLGSGSRGNALLIRSGTTAVLVDAGFSRKELGRRLELVGCSLEALIAVLVTHEHGDHTAALKLLGRRPELKFCWSAGTAGAVALGTKACCAQQIVAPGQSFSVDGWKVQAFATSHDAAESLGFRFEFPDGTRLGIATDLGEPSDEVVAALQDCDLLGLEFNHDPQLLQDGPYPWILKKRVASGRGHLSNAQAGELVEAVAGPRLRQLIGLHLSETNNRPELARKAMQAALRRAGVDAAVTVAAQNKPTSVQARHQLSLLA